MADTPSQRARELLACPFCRSSEVSISFSATMQSPEPYGRFVECENCTASGPAFDNPLIGDEAAKAKAVEAWNTRSDTAYAQGRADERRAVVDAIKMRQAIYQTRLDQASERDHLTDDYNRADLFSHAVEAFNYLLSELGEHLGEGDNA